MSIPFLSNIIIDDAGHIQFKTSAGANAGKIDQDGDNLVLSNAVGDIIIGNGSDDVYIGDGTNAVDIRFEQNMAIYADSSSTRTLTLGGANTNLILDNPSVVGDFTLASKLKFTGSTGYILFDYEPSGDTGEYTTEVPLLKVDMSGSESTILSRVSEYRAVALGIDDTVWLRAGDTSSVIKSNVNLSAEQVLMSAEGGFIAYGFPGNDTAWSNRVEFQFRTDSTTASSNGLYIGDGGRTQFIDLSRNLKNITSLSTGTVTVTNSDPGITFVDSSGSTYDGIIRFKDNFYEWLWGGGIKFRVSPDGGIGISQDYSTTYPPAKGLIMPGRLGVGTDTPDQMLHVKSADNNLAVFESTDPIAEIRIKDSVKYTRLLATSTDFKLMPNDGASEFVFEGDTGNFVNPGGFYLSSDNYIHFDNGVSNSYAIRKSGTTLQFKTGGTYNFQSGNATFAGTVTATYFYGDGSNLTNISATDSTKVAKAGDTMTGNLTLNDNVNLRFGTGGAESTIKSDGADTIMTLSSGAFMIGTNSGTPHDNSGKADFVVDINDNPQISLYSNQVQMGSTDMNWNSKWLYDGSTKIASWNSNIEIFTQGSTGNTEKTIFIRPQGADGTITTRAKFMGDTGNYLYGPNYMVSDGSNADGATLKLIHANNNTTDTIGTVWFGNNADNTLSSISSNTSGANNTSDLVFKTSNAGSLGTALTLGANNSATFTGTAAAPTLYGNHANGNGSSLILGRADTSNYWHVNHAGADFRLYNSASSGSNILFGVDPSGTVKANSVGIGTPDPTEKLHVVGNIKASGELEGGSLDINGDGDISGNLNITGNITNANWQGDVIAATKGGTGLTSISTLLNSNSFANFVSTSADYDTITTRGLYRFTGASNGPAGTSHTTGITLTEGSGNYGWQMASNGSSNNTEGLYYRYRNTSWGPWQTIVTKTFGDGRYLLDSEVTNLAAVKAFDPSDYATSAQGATADNALQNIVEDTSPQLGGHLDMNGKRMYETNEATASIDLKDHGGYTWLRNSAYKWIFQGGTGGDDWTQSFALGLETVGTGFNDKWALFGQQSNNGSSGGKYKGVRIVKSTGSGSVVDGDLQAGDATFSGDLTVTGDLNITGDINSYNVTDLDVTDKTITIGKGQTEANSGGSGIIVDGSGASMLWDESDDRWEFNKNIYTAGTILSATTITAQTGVRALDSDGTNVHGFMGSNANEGTLRLSNGSNWGLIARGVSNDPRIGAYHGGQLKIEGFHNADGSEGANTVNLAQFNFSSGILNVNGNITLTGTVDGVDIATRDALMVTTNGDQTISGRKTYSHGDGVRIQSGSQGNTIRLVTNNDAAQIADTFAANTAKSYIYFDARTGSNDPGYIMHETSTSEANEAVLHLVPSDDNSYGDYVSIHGTNDADCLKLHTSGRIETASGYQLSILSGSGSVQVEDSLQVTGDVNIGSNTVGRSFNVFGAGTGEGMFWNGNDSHLTIMHDDGDLGLEIYTVNSTSPTTPQLKIGRNADQYWGVFTDDRNAYMIHRQDETSGQMSTKFDQWDSNTSDNTGYWAWRSGDGSGGSMNTAAELYQDGDFVIQGDLSTTKVKARTSGGLQLTNDDDSARVWIKDTGGVYLRDGGDKMWTSSNHGPNGQGGIEVYNTLLTTYIEATDVYAYRLYARVNNTDLTTTSITLQANASTPASDTLIFKANDATQLTLGDGYATFTGNVTVGSNSLTAGSLDINGNADISGNLTGVDNLTINGTLSGISTATFAGDVQILTSSGEYAVYAAADGQTALYNNGVKKFETTSTGIDVTGNITANGSNATISAAESGGATTKIMGASVGRVGTSSNHNLEILSNNTAAITIDTSQNATFTGDVTTSGYYLADTHFRSTDTAAVLSTTGAGIIYLRPNNYNSTTGQFTLNSSGSGTFSGRVNVENNSTLFHRLEHNFNSTAANSTSTLEFGTGTYAFYSQIFDGGANVLTLTASDASSSFAGAVTVLGDLKVNEYIKHNGDDNTHIRLQSDSLDIYTGGWKVFGNTTLKYGALYGDNSLRVYATQDGGRIAGKLTIDNVLNATGDPDKFLCINGSGVVGYRTGSQVLSDIGAGSAVNYGNNSEIPYISSGAFVYNSEFKVDPQGGWLQLPVNQSDEAFIRVLGTDYIEFNDSATEIRLEEVTVAKSGLVAQQSGVTTTDLTATGTIQGKIKRSPNGTTAVGGTGDNNYFAKIATFSIPSNQSYDDIRHVIEIVGEEASLSAYARVLVTLRKNASSSTELGHWSIQVLDCDNAGDINPIIRPESFYLRYNASSAMSVDLYMKKFATYGQFNIYENASNAEDWSVTYTTNSAWIAALPSATYSKQATHTTGTVMTVHSFQTNSGSGVFIPQTGTSTSSIPAYYHNFIPPGGGILERVSIRQNTNNAASFRVYGGSTGSSVLTTVATLDASTNTLNFNPNTLISPNDMIRLWIDPISSTTTQWNITCYYKF